MRTHALALVALALVLPRGTAAAPHPANCLHVQALIEQLGDDLFTKREEASRDLEALGEIPYSALRKAFLSSTDPEISRRTRRLIQAILRKVPVRIFTGHTDGVIVVALSPDGKLALSGPVCYTSRDSTVRLWNVQSGKELLRLKGHYGGVYSATFAPDGKTAITGGDDHVIRIWEMPSGKERRRITAHGGTIYSLAYSPDGKTILSGSSDGTCRLWNVATGEELRRFTEHRGTLRTVAFSPNGKLVLSRGVFQAQSVRLYDVGSGKEVHQLDVKYSGKETLGSMGVIFSPDGKLVASTESENMAGLWDVKTGKLVRTLPSHHGEVSSVAFTPDSKTLLTGDEGGLIRLWDVSTGKELGRLTGHSHRVWSLACSQDGKHVLSGSFDRTLRLWKLPQ